MIPVLFQDGRFLVLDKPAGMPVHPVRGAATRSVEDLFSELGPRRRDGPWLAHRLDRDTAGCLLVARRKAALLAAQACFADGRAAKTYWAVVRGGPATDTGRRESRLRRVERGRAWWMEEDPAAGDPADTGWRVRGRAPDRGLAWLELTPRTGRTHQVRVHCRALGCPVLGDAIYGEAPDPGVALHLLARRLALPLDPPVEAVAPPPPHMRAALAACGWRPDAPTG